MKVLLKNFIKNKFVHIALFHILICVVGCKDSKQPKADANSHEAEKAKTVDSAEISDTEMHIYSEIMDSADADYCLNFKSKNDTLIAKPILAKKHKDLKILLNIQEPLKCEDYEFYTTAYFRYFKGIESVFMEPIIKSASLNRSFIRGTDGRFFDKVEYYEHKKTGKLQPVMQVNVPQNAGYIPLNGKKREKEYFLQFENKIITATLSVKVKCLPHLDTIYHLKDFRAKITGECENP